MAGRAIEPAEALKKYRVVAVVGASKSPEKEAFTVPLYLSQKGYLIIPINPTAERIHGERAYPSLHAIPKDVAETVEIVNVFRPSEELAEVAAQVAEMKKRTGRPFVFWSQLGLENEEAKRTLEAAGIDYVMNACMRTQHQMLASSM